MQMRRAEFGVEIGTQEDAREIRARDLYLIPVTRNQCTLSTSEFAALQRRWTPTALRGSTSECGSINWIAGHSETCTLISGIRYEEVIAGRCENGGIRTYIAKY